MISSSWPGGANAWRSWPDGCAETPAPTEVLVADLTDAGALAEVEARIEQDDALALLVNNAGFGGYRPFTQLDPNVIDDLIGVHIRAVARLTRAALPGWCGGAPGP